MTEQPRVSMADLDDDLRAEVAALTTEQAWTSIERADEPPPYDFVPGDVFLIDEPAEPSPPIWGDGSDVLWSSGEPLIVTGPIGAGKTTLLGRLCRARVGLQDDILGYPVAPAARRVLYLACDRPTQIAQNLARMFTSDDRDRLRERLSFWKGPPLADCAQHPSLLLDMCHKADADTLIIDGLKDVALDLSKDDVGSRLNHALQKCIADDVEVVANHHQRKASNGTERKPRALADMYGSTWIAAGVGSVVLMWADRPGSTYVTVETLKPSREHVGPLDVRHDMEFGDLVAVDRMTPADVLRASTEPRTLNDVLAALEIDGADRNKREQVRRRLDRLVNDDKADVIDVPRQGGGRPEKHYLWTAR